MSHSIAVSLSHPAANDRTRAEQGAEQGLNRAFSHNRFFARLNEVETFWTLAN
jgi:hypothetical protein